jgi:hypothetical protein
MSDSIRSVDITEVKSDAMSCNVYHPKLILHLQKQALQCLASLYSCLFYISM